MTRIQVSPVAFNENVKLKSVIERFLKSPLYGKADYVIVDDGSRDGTTEVIEGYKNFSVKTLRHPERLGVGAAIRTAIEEADKNGCEIIVLMAGNDKDNPEEILRLLDPILKEGYDLVQGSRWLGPDGTGGDMPFYRKLATKFHPWLMSVLTHQRMTDTTNGFRAIRLSLFKDGRIQLNQEWLDTYELEPYILFKALTLGYKVKEVSVTKIYPSKKLGYTKMRPFIGWWSILRPLIYLKLGIRK